MPPSKPSSSEDQFIYKTVLAVCGAIAALYVLVPTVVAAGVFLVIKDKLRRRDWWILFAGALVVLLFGGGSSLLGEYSNWVTRFFPPFDDVYVSASVVVAVVMLATALVSLAGLLNGTALAARIPGMFRSTPLGEKPSIVPTDRERDKLSVVTPVALDPVEVSAALVAQARPGERPIVLGPGRSGTPVVVTEKELGTHALIFGATGSGKALALSTPIPTPSGWTTMGELNVGDMVFDESGTPTRVVFATPTQLDRQCFDVVFSNGDAIVADAEHRWLTTDVATGTTAVRTTLDMTASKTARYAVPLTAPLQLAAVEVEFDVYQQTMEHGPTTELLRGSIDQRLAVLRALMDADGLTVDGFYHYCATTPDGATVVRDLVCSLAGFLSPTSTSQRVVFALPQSPYLHSKQELLDGACAARLVEIVDIVEVDSVPVRCIQVDSPTHLYLAGDSMIPTHNTETIKSLAGGLLDLGWDGILLDLKEDTKPGGLRDWCETYADSHRIGYQELRLSDARPRFWFDALSGLSQDEARDTILSLTRFDDEYYKNVSIKVLGQLLKLQYWAHEVDPATCPLPTLYDIAHVLGAPSLTAATKKLRAIVSQAIPDLQKSEFQVLESPDQVSQNQAASWGAKLGNLYETQAGRVVLKQPPAGENRQKLDVTSGGLMYIGLDSQGKPDLTKLVSSAVLQRISVEAAQRTTGTTKTAVKPKFLIVDEANWVDRTIVQNLLSRARSAGVAMMLCTQGPKDWIDKNGDDFARLAQNTNVAMIMKQGEPEAAQICADYIGNTTYKEFTARVDETSAGLAGNLRDKLDNIVSPDELRGLRVGEMILRVSSPRVRTEWVQVNMRDPKANPPGSITPRNADLGPTKGPGLARPPLN